MNHSIFRCCVLLLAIALGLFWHRPAQAATNVSCTATMTNVSFGTVNPLSSGTNANATLSYTCTNSASATRYATACFSVGDGVQGAGQTNPRQMEDASGDVLRFQLYQDAAHTSVWGSQFFGVFLTPLMVNVTVAGSRSVSGQATMYGQVVNGQTGAIPNTYQDQFSGAHTAITVNDSSSNYPNACDSTIAGTFPFTVTATVAKQCNVSASPLNFGNSVGLLTATVNATTTLGVQCSSNTSYNVGLDAGLNGGGNINARKMVLGANSVAYQLYQNSARTQVWGNTVGTNTAAGTGTGSTQSLTVYGQVPVQATPPAGTYNDTIVVTVTY
jgi:spore coat protein U domain-containing protein, fimbrial subunit CupE1/2/3/6